MKRGKISDAVQQGRILISDGAWGTYLQAKGLKPGECPDYWSVTHPGEVLEIARSYIAAGSDMVQTNSFGGSSLKLQQYGLGDQAADINRAAARISREAAGEEKWVIASLGPSGKMVVTGEVTEAALYESFRGQAQALEQGGADAICIETMFALDEAIQAIRAVKENTACEIISTFTFELTRKGEYRTMMGVSPPAFAEAVVAAGADIIGTNCGNGMARMIDIVKEIKAVFPGKPVLVHANAGLPVNTNGRDVFPETPEQMAAFVPALIAAGANIIGGCCGTTPDHIRAIRKAALGVLADLS